MPKVTYVADTGESSTVDAQVGESVMAAAVKHGVSGIIGECGGNASCATCHVYVRPDFLPLLAEIKDDEDDLLDLGVGDRRPSSRLSCQIRVTEELDGLTVDLPEEQA